MNGCKLRMTVQHLGTNKYIPLVSCVSNLFTSWHCLLKSRSIVHGKLQVHIAIASEFSQLWGMDSRWCRLYCQPFPEHNYWNCGMGFRSSFAAIAHEGWSIHADLSGSGSHQLIVVFNALSTPPLAAVSRNTLIISLRLASRASLSSLFSSPCYVGSHCSAFLSC